MLTDDDLNKTDRELLGLLRDGRVTPPYVAEELGISREYASERLIRLKEHKHADRIASGLYELVDDPEGLEDVEEKDVEEKVERVRELERELELCQERVQELEQQDGGVDVQNIESALETAATALDGQHPNVELARAEIQSVLEDINND